MFRVTFHLDPEPGVAVEPERFETTLGYRAPPPGEEGWLFLRGRPVARRGERPGAPPGAGGRGPRRRGRYRCLREFRTGEAYLSALRDAIAAALVAFRAEDVDEALHSYLGSSIHVRQ